ncbi:hypothetical protein HDV00_010073 [Rhizophlyctis rosea]|nr:hypothetical protein HDV00_010073 [Rhizophlyctis rosea]
MSFSISRHRPGFLFAPVATLAVSGGPFLTQTTSNPAREDSGLGIAWEHEEYRDERDRLADLEGREENEEVLTYLKEDFMCWKLHPDGIKAPISTIKQSARDPFSAFPVLASFATTFQLSSGRST